MKSLQMNAYGRTETLSFSEIPVPVLSPGDILVKVAAVGINPFDIKLLTGEFRNEIPQQLPVTIGSDFAGEVMETGSQVTHFQKGMKVYGSGISIAGGSGALAEFLRVKGGKISVMPDNTSYIEAAAFVTPGCTAQQAVSWNLNVKPGQKILIIGGAGAVGSLATQMCLNIGAHVAVTVGNEDIPYMKELGVDLIINYHLQPFENLIHDYDGVLDTQGGETLLKCFGVLKPGGTLVSLVSKPSEELCREYGVKGVYQMTEINTRSLNTLNFLIEEKILKPHHIVEVPFNEAIAAIDHKLKGNFPGKVVITMN
ncbi:MAG: NADP-dependent oxidoreductase [Bacteroidales bacterium]